ncbi:unnamed protein product [Owenia fusiformis]|uniref:Uncharacterized protein n=1 Tax=Owenia fusiformis TaxID=6347 RepID=A0A8J1TVP3_OWEFU|nr:unnamed protein product [Owenia fusiformis]
MVDITARLVWYKLGETYSNMADAASNAQTWYTTMDWEKVDLLDAFFIGVVVLTVVSYGVLTVVFSLFGKQIKDWQKPKPRWSETGEGSSPNFGESCQWVNSAVNWLYLHYTTTPDFLQAWLNALNEASRQHGENVQVKFDCIQPGSLPPKVTNVHTDVGPSDTLNIRAKIETKELSFMVGVLHQIMDTISVTNCSVSIEKLNAEVKTVASMENDNVSLAVSLHGAPEMKLRIKPHSQNYDLNISRVETAIIKAIHSAVTILNVSKGTMGSFYGSPPTSPNSPASMMTPNFPVNEVIQKTDDLHLHSANIAKVPGNRRLLVKIIKANGLRQADYGSTDPYVVIELDEPLQKHTTSVVKSTVNPFWDEHFLFDLGDNTSEVMFEVYDREKPPGEDFLGCNIVHMEELRRNPSSRQIIPLLPRPDKTEVVSGSITIEFLFLEPAEAALYQNEDLSSPRRQVETARHVTPSGTVITTTTTTTERPRDMKYETSINDSPNLVIKRDIGRTDGVSTSPVGNRTRKVSDSYESSITSELVQVNGDETVADTAVRQLTTQRDSRPRTPTRTSTLVITSVQRMTDSSPTEDKDALSATSAVSSTSTERVTPTVQNKKNKSLKNTLKKRFSRLRKPRSHSADRASSMREGTLSPPTMKVTGPKTTDDIDHLQVPEQNLKKQRSNSFSNSLKKLFKRKKRDGASVSRESSLSRQSQREYGDHSPEPSPVAQRDPIMHDPSRSRYS